MKMKSLKILALAGLVAALLTGRYSPRVGLGSIIIAGTPLTIQEGEVTMAELFKSQGYATGIVGKWHLGGLSCIVKPIGGIQ